MDLVQPLLAVAVVLGLLWAAVRFLKSRKLAIPSVRAFSARKESGLEVLGRVPLTPSHSVCKIRDGDRCLLIGLSANGIVLLSECPEAYGKFSNEPEPRAGAPSTR